MESKESALTIALIIVAIAIYAAFGIVVLTATLKISLCGAVVI